MMKTLWITAYSEQCPQMPPRQEDGQGFGDCVVEAIAGKSSIQAELARFDLVILEAAAGVLLPHQGLAQLWASEIPVIVKAAPHEEAIAWQLLQQGAQDYIIELSELSYVALAHKAQHWISHKHAEIELQHSEHEYRLLIENLPAGVVVHGPNTEILTNNTRATELLELTPAQMQGKTALDPAWSFIREDGSPLPLAEYPVNRVLTTRRPIENEVIGVNRPVSGTLIWVLINAYPVFLENQALDRAIVTFVDITAQKQAQIDLIASEQRYASLAQAAPVGIFRTDPEGNCIYVNDRWSAIAGITPEQALGQGWIAGLHPEDRAAIAAEWYAASQSQRPFSLEYRFLNAAQTTTWVYGQAVAEMDAQGQVSGYIGTVTDITERHLAEEQLQENEYLVRSLFELGNIGLGINNVDGGWLRINPKLCQLLGYTAQELQQTTWQTLTAPDDLAIDLAYLQQLLRGDIAGYELDKHMIHKNGELIPVHLTVSCARHENGDVHFVIASLQDIRDRLHMEAELRESEARYRLLFDMANDLVLLHPLGTLDHPGCCLTDVNATTCQLLGYTREELQQLTPLDLIPPVEIEAVPEELDTLTATGQLLFEKTLIAKDGSRIPVELHAHVFDWNGRAMVLSIARDISERRATQAILETRERLFRSLFEQSAVAMAMASPTGHFIRVNQKMCDLLGYTEAELLTMPSNELRHPDYRAAHQGNLKRVLAGEVTTFGGDEVFLRRDGCSIWLNTCISLIRDAAGQPEYFVKVVQDVNDRVQAHAALTASEALFRDTFEQAAVGISHVAPTGKFIRLNQRFCDIVGYTHEELIQLNFKDITHPDDLQVDLEYVNRLLAGDISTYNLEKRYVHKDGTTLWIHLTVSLVWTAAGDPDYFIAVVQDISDRKAVQERLSLALSSANQGIYDLNLITDEAIVGREYALMLGYDPDTFSETVTSWRKRVHPEDRAAVATAYRDYALGEVQQYRAEFRMLTRQGTWRWVLSVGKFVAWDANGNPTRLLGTHTDIDGRKRAEAALQELNQSLERRVLQRTKALSAVNDRLQLQTAVLHQTNQLLTLVMDSIPQRIYWKDRNFILLGCNRHFAEDMGCTVAAAIGRSNHDFSATPEEAAFFDACDRQVIESGQPSLHMLETLHRADGVTIHLEKSLVPLRNAQGEVMGLLGCYEDITQRCLMEAQLQQQLQKERLLSSLMQRTRETLNLQETFNLTVQQVRELLNINRVLICTIDANRQVQIAAESSDRECLALSQLVTATQQIKPSCYRQFLSGQVFTVADVPQAGLPEHMAIFTDYGLEIQAEIMVPIVEHDTHRVCGLLIGHQCNQPREWQPWELQFLEQLSSHLAIAIRQIRLYDQLQIELQHRKQVEQSLRTSEEHLKLVTDSVNGCIAYVDAAERYQFINRTYEDWFGWKKADILDRSVEAVLGTDAYAQIRHYVERALAGEAVTYEAELPYQQGGTRYILASLVPDVNQQQQVNGYYALITDISDRKQAEIALQESRRFIERIANASPNLIYLYDLQAKRNLYVNQEIGPSLGYQPEEVQAMGQEVLPTLMHPEDWLRFQAYLPQLTAAKDGEVREFEYRMHHKDGKWQWFISRDTIFARDAAGQVTQIVGSAQDITDRKAAEALIQSQAARETLLREITQRIRNTLDLSTIFSTACDEIRQVLQCDRVGIFQFDQASHFTLGEFVAEAAAAHWPSILHMPVADHCFGQQYAEHYRQGRYLIANDIYQDGLSACHAQILAVFGVKACMVLPLIQGEELWGLLCVHHCQQPRVWQSFEIDLVHQLSNQMAIAIQQAKFHAQIQLELAVRKQAEQQIARQLREQQTLAAVTQVTRESLDMEETLALFAAQVREALAGDRVIIFRLFDDGRTRIVEESVDADLPHLKHQQWADETWSLDILARYWQGKPRVIPDVMQDQWTACLQEYSVAGKIRSKMVAPILQYDAAVEINRWTQPETRTKIWGLLVIHACHQKRIWQSSEARLLQQIANQLAIAVRQANLFERLQTELQERQNTQNLLTERNQQLANSNQQLARATRMKDEFLANVSHEIRTPMNAIVGMTKLALETSLTPKQRNYLEKIDKSAAALLHVINDILDFSKIEAGKLTLEEVTFSLEEVLSNLSDVTSLQASSKALELLFSVAVDTPLNIVGDPLRLGQILLNLVSNAIKFTEQGHILVAVSLVAADVYTYKLRFSVTDTGIGLSPEQQSRLFKAFSQGDTSTTRRFGGTGLGLVISKRLATLMQGEIGVDGVLGEGATFWFTATFRKPPTPVQTLSARYSHQPDLQAMRILVVDDNAAARTVFHEMLRNLHCRPTVVGTAASAIAALAAAQRQQDPYQVVIVDYVMPGTDGIALIQQIKQLATPQAMPALLLVTAHRQSVVKDTAQTAGIQHILYKPLQPATLLDTIIEALQSDATRHPAPPEGTPSPVPVNVLSNVRVLLVEDHEINQELAIDFLTQAGASVTVASNGQDAYHYVCQKPFDVVLMDCQMPVMDGYEATQTIRALPHGGQVPIIAMTANVMQGDRQKCLAVGMNDYLAKPIIKEELYATIQRWVFSEEVPSRILPPSMPTPAPALLPGWTFAQLSSFNIELGLRYVANNPALYAKLLGKFLVDNRAFAQQMQQALTAGNYPEALRLAHSLKGTCGTLGCEALKNNAQRLEQALLEQQAGFDEAVLFAVLEQLGHVLAELEAWQQTQPSKPASKINAADIDWQAVHQQVHLMDQALETDLGAALEALTWMQTTLHHDAQANEIVDALTTHLDSFEIDHAKHVLQALAQLAESYFKDG